MGYAKDILRDWVDKGARTAEDIQADDAKFKKRQAKRSTYFKRSPKAREDGVMPDWFKEWEKEQQLEADNKQKQAVQA